MAAPLTLKLNAYTELSSADRAGFEALSRRSIREVCARRDLIREGDRPRSVFLILSGWACRYKTLPDGRCQIVALVLPGDLCDLHVHALRTMDHSVGAITPLQAAEIGGDEFEQLLQDHPRIAQALYWDELVKIAIQREWTVNLGQRSAYERIAHLLCECHLRLRAVGLAQEHSCPFPLTQADLADATGLTTVHVNRTLQELRKDGVIELYGRKLHVPNLQRLKSAALFNANYLHLDHEGRHLDAGD